MEFCFFPLSWSIKVNKMSTFRQVYQGEKKDISCIKITISIRVFTNNNNYNKKMRNEISHSEASNYQQSLEIYEHWSMNI